MYVYTCILPDMYLALPVSEEVYVIIDFRKVLSQHVYTAELSRVPSPRGTCVCVVHRTSRSKKERLANVSPCLKKTVKLPSSNVRDTTAVHPHSSGYHSLPPRGRQTTLSSKDTHQVLPFKKHLLVSLAVLLQFKQYYQYALTSLE